MYNDTRIYYLHICILSIREGDGEYDDVIVLLSHCSCTLFSLLSIVIVANLREKCFRLYTLNSENEVILKSKEIPEE